MKVEVGLSGELEVTHVYNPIVLKTDSGEYLAICMRDSGFEFKYQGVWYSAKGGVIETFDEVAARAAYQKDSSFNHISEAQSDGEAELKNTNNK
jgi:hypothetical protein